MSKENKLAKAIERTKEYRSPKKPKEAKFLGQQVNKENIQNELNELDHEDRVVLLTQNEKIDLIEKLKNKAKEDMIHGLSLYEEYREIVSDEFDDYEDRNEAFWVNGQYLQELADRKAVTEYYESLRDEL